MQELASATRVLVSQYIEARKENVAGGPASRAPRATIQIRPIVAWPQLVDADRKIKRFWAEFDDVVGLANDGQGIAVREQLKVLQNCVKQSYAELYRVEVEKAVVTGEYRTNPGKQLQRIRESTVEFEETILEQQQRADTEWDALSRGRMTGLQFKPRFEQAIAELERAGVGKSERELFISYLKKCGQPFRTAILKD